VLSVRVPVTALWIAAMLVAVVVPVAPLFLAPLVLAGVVLAVAAGVVRRHLRDVAPQPALVALGLAPHRARAALSPIRS
jgi:hypothetical protein